MEVDYDKTYCVYNTTTNKRVSQYYSRAGDAKRKAKSMNWNGLHPYYKAFEFKLELVKEIT